MGDVEGSATALMMEGSMMEAVKPKEKVSTHETVRKALLEQTRATNWGGVIMLKGVRMCVPYTIYVPSNVSKPDLHKTIDDVFNTTETTFSPFAPGSELDRLNSHPHGPDSVPFPVSDAMWDVLMCVDVLWRATSGLFDPSWAGMASLWKESLARGAEPTRDANRASIEAAAGWANLKLKDKTVWKATPMKIDLCGLTKGWCVDLLVERLHKGLGIRDVCVDWGGDSKFVGTHPSENRPWVSAIVKPPALRELFAVWQGTQEKSTTPGEYLHSVKMPPKGQAIALATSGDYSQLERFGYYHIFHPGLRTPMQVSDPSIASATICATSCMMADALATCCMLHGRLGPALDFIRSQPILNYYMYSRHGNTFVHDEGDGIPYMPPSLPSMVLAKADCLEQHNTPSAVAVRDMMRGMPTLYTVAVAGTITAVLSSVVQWTLHGVTLMSMNLMKSSELHHALRNKGKRFALHVLTSDDVREAVAIKDYGDMWLGTSKVANREGVSFLASMPHNLYICEVMNALEAGDHSFVVVKVVHSEWPTHVTPLVHMHKRFFVPESVPCSPQEIVTPAMAFSSNGSAVPALHLRCCSLKPPMITFIVCINAASRAVFMGPSPSVHLHITLLSDENDVFAGANFHAFLPNNTNTPPTPITSFDAVTMLCEKCDEQAEDGYLQIMCLVETISKVSPREAIALTYAAGKQTRLAEVH